MTTTYGKTYSLFGLLAACALVAGCGKSKPSSTLNSQSPTNTGIIGGEEVTNNDAFSKSIVAVVEVHKVMGEDGQVHQTVGLCTGTILSKNLILTAAHCAQSAPESYRVIFGLDIMAKDRVIRGVSAVAANPQFAQTMDKFDQMTAEIIKNEKEQNPSFDPKHPSEEALARLRKQLNEITDKVNDWGDVALFKLEKDIPDGYVPAHILKNSSAIQNDGSVLLAGYGITHAENSGTSQMELSPRNKMDVTFEGRDEDMILRKVSVQVKDRDFSRSEILLDQTKGKGACHGDSGGPAYSEVDGQLYVWGVTSRGIHDPGNTCGTYSAYTNILTHDGWIVETAAKIGAEL